MSTYTIGQQVENPNHGKGVITGIEGAFIVIDFGTNGTKRVFASMFKQGAYNPAPEPIAPAAREMNAGEIAQTIFASTGIWQADMQEFAAKVAAKAEGNTIMSDIISKWRKTHRASIAQAGAIARFAYANNITF